MKFKVLSVVTTTLTVTGILFFDKASKAQFSGSCTIPNFEVYQHDDGGGASFRGCSNEYNSLRDDPNIINDFNWNDEISSIRTSSNPVSLYSDSQFQGSCIVVSTGSIRSSSALNLRPLGFNDVVSSIRVGRDSRCTDLTASSSTNTPPNVRRSEVGLRGIVHLQDIGDVPFQGGAFAGTRGESRRLEGFSIAITDGTPNLGIQYMAHIQNIGDTTWVNGGQFIGTRGESRRLEGFAIRLTGSNAANYNIRYICHLQDIGDTQVRSNGEFCGTRGESRRLEGLQVWIERK